MAFFTVLVYILQLTTLTLASPIAHLAEPLADHNALAARAVDVCAVVNTIVKVLKPSEATPFCSSFLSIRTATVATTITVPSTTTSISTSSVTVTFPTTVATATKTVTIFTTNTQTKTKSETSTMSMTATTTSTVTPPAITAITTTSYTTAATAAKRSVQLEQRAVKVPSQLVSLASNVVSTVCNCLSIPTPTTTTTQTTTAIQTVRTSTVITVTSLVPATATKTDTATVSDTEFVYTTISTTVSTTTTTTITTTLPTPTATSVVYKPLDPRCVNLENGNLYNGIAIYRSVAFVVADDYPLGSKGSPQYDNAYCCQLCHQTPDCAGSSPNTYDDGDAHFTQCLLVTYTDQVETDISPSCPRGVEADTSFSNRGSVGYAVGNCLITRK